MSDKPVIGRVVFGGVASPPKIPTPSFFEEAEMEFNKVQSTGLGERVFETGSKRDVRKGKGRFDLLSPFVTKRDAIHMENGAEKYDARNWEKGQPLMSYLDSAERHLNCMKEDFLLGRAHNEDHAAAIRWNIASYIHTEEMIKRGLLPKDLDDRPKPQPRIEGKEYNDRRNVPFGVSSEDLCPCEYDPEFNGIHHIDCPSASPCRCDICTCDD